MKRVLITGRTSYIGTNLKKWLEKEPDNFKVEIISVRGDDWKSFDFSKFDVVVHAAGLVHKKVSEKNQYYIVNRDLVNELVKKARHNGIKQFVFLSTMAIYGLHGAVNKELKINAETIPNPQTHYAISKFEAEKQLQKLNSVDFKVAILRLPIVYGENSPGNYSRLQTLAKYVWIFPSIENSRSMISIENLCLKIQKVIENDLNGIYFPQDEKYHSTMQIMKSFSKKIYFSKILGNAIKILFSNTHTFQKLFGNLVYDQKGNL